MNDTSIERQMNEMHVKKLNTDSFFSWVTTDNKQNIEYLGWYNPTDEKLLFPEAKITRLADGRWMPEILLTGNHHLEIEPTKKMAKESVVEYLDDFRW